VASVLVVANLAVSAGAAAVVAHGKNCFCQKQVLKSEFLENEFLEISQSEKFLKASYSKGVP
jgi:hypothetical protein